MSAHVDFAGVLFIIWGLLTTLIGLSTLSLSIAAASIVSSGGHSPNFLAGFIAVAFMTLALIAIVWGLAHIAVGVPLRRRHPHSRLAALTLGAVDLLLLPYGTALGCYTLWALLNEEGKKLFA